MKKILLTIFAVMLLAAMNTAAWANGPYTASLPRVGGIPTPHQTGTPSNHVPDVYNAINLLLGSSYGSNAAVDPLEYTGPTSVWENVGASDHGGAALVGLSAANANTLEVYNTATPATKVDIFGGSFSGFGFVGDGTSTHPFPGAAVPFATGTSFGWSLNSVGHTSNVWDSNPASNWDHIDHLLVYHLTPLAGKTVWIQDTQTLKLKQYTYQDPYLLAWEDQQLNHNGVYSDQDYNDMMYVVDRVVPVPEPMTLALFTLGLMGIAAFGLRRKMVLA